MAGEDTEAVVLDALYAERGAVGVPLPSPVASLRSLELTAVPSSLGARWSRCLDLRPRLRLEPLGLW